MRESEHTPGPWHAYPNPARDDGWFVSTVEMKDTNSRVIRDGAVVPYRVPAQNITFFQINKAANARLIAAAPTLYSTETNLCNELSGALEQWETALRSVMGNTNYNVLKLRCDEARAALSSISPQTVQDRTP